MMKIHESTKFHLNFGTLVGQNDNTHLMILNKIELLKKIKTNLHLTHNFSYQNPTRKMNIRKLAKL